MQCFGSLWVDILLSLAVVFHILPLFFKKEWVQNLLLAVNLLCHGGLILVMLIQQLPLEEVLVLVLASALLTLSLGYIQGRRAKP